MNAKSNVANVATTMQRPLWLALAAAALALSLSPTLGIADDRADPVNAVEAAVNLRLSAFGLTADQRLVRFPIAVPQVARSVGKISNLSTPDTALIGIDFRVQDGKLYGVGNAGGIYTIDTATAVAALSPASPLDITFDANSKAFGVDFNPAANALRIITDTGQNLRHPFGAGATQFVTQNDTTLSYPPAAPPATGLSGAAYTNNDLDTTTGTTLLDIDAMRNQVAIQSPANNGLLVPTGAPTVDAEAPIGFDIYTALTNGKAVRNSGFASLTVGGQPGLYRINLTTGEANFIGSFFDKVVDIALPLNQ